MRPNSVVHAVGFAGERAGVAGLTWGHQAIWDPIRWYEPHDHVFNFGKVLPADGIGLDRVLATVGALVSTYETLRTTFGDSGGVPCQMLASTGRLDVEVLDAGEAAEDTAESVRDRLAGERFAEAGLPLRVAVVTSAGAPRFVVLVVSHLAADGWGFRLLADQLGRFDPDGTSDAGAHPLDLAAWEASPEGADADRAAAEHWARQIGRAPGTMFTAPPLEAAEPGWWSGELVSSALCGAVWSVAARLGVSTSAVLLAATSIVLARHTGAGRCALLAILSNRADPALAATVGTITEDALVVVDVGDLSFADVAGQAAAELAEARRHGRYRPATVAGVRAGTDLRCYFNDCRFDDAVAPESDDAPATFRPLPGSELEDSAFFLDVEQDGPALRVSLLVDTRLFAPAAVEELLRELEDVVTAEASGRPVRAQLS